jgi:hypothetical protein
VSTPPVSPRLDLAAVPTHRLLEAAWAAHELCGLAPALRAAGSAGFQADLGELLAQEWADRLDDALKESLRLLLADRNAAMTPPALDALLGGAGETLGDGFADAVGEDVSSLIRDAYMAGRQSVLRPLRIGFVEQLVDERAQSTLENDSLYWVGSYWDRDLGQSIADAINGHVIQKGLSRGDAGAVLQAMLGGDFPDKSTRYWELVASAGVQRASVFGAIGSFRQTGVRTVRFLNPGDLRTSEICAHLNGVIFQADVAYRVVDNFIAAGSPEDAKAAHSWPDKQRILETRDPTELAAIGIVPPLHGHCRSVLVPVVWSGDASEEVEA